MKLQDLYGLNQITLYGEGYYSGQSCSHVAFVTEEFYEDNKEKIADYTPYFCDLNGKHSVKS